MQSHQSQQNINTVVHSQEDSTNGDNSTIEPYKNRGLGKEENVGEKSTSILYNSSNCYARISHKHSRHGELGLQLSLLHYI